MQINQLCIIVKQALMFMSMFRVRGYLMPEEIVLGGHRTR